MSLSKAYNLAQEKLLDTERVLMNESILVEKQRSLLEVLSAATKIYKYILSEAMEDESILTFISHIQEDAHSQSNSPNNSLNNSRNYSHCQQEIKD